MICRPTRSPTGRSDTMGKTALSLEEARAMVLHVAKRMIASRDLLTQAGLEIVVMSASNCLAVNWNDHLMRIREDATKWNELLRMELEATREPGCLDMGTHLIAVARKL